MKDNTKKGFETVDDAIEFLINIQKTNEIGRIKNVYFECWGPNHLKNFNIEYFSPEDFKQNLI